jgi:hypothetical protein
MFILKKESSPEPAGHALAIKLGTDISCMMGIQVFSNESQSPLQRGKITKVQK